MSNMTLSKYGSCNTDASACFKLVHVDLLDHFSQISDDFLIVVMINVASPY